MNPNKSLTQKPARKFDARLQRIVRRVVDQAGVVLDAIMPKSTPAPAPDDRDSVQRAIGRWRNDRLALWRLCEKRGCRRARRCCGQPGLCLAAHAREVSPGALTGVRTLLKSRLGALDAQNLPLDARNNVAAVKAWLGPVSQSGTLRAPRGTGAHWHDAASVAGSRQQNI